MHVLKARHWRVRPVRGLLLLMPLSLAMLAVTAAAPLAAQADSQSASVTVNAGDDLGTVGAHPFGVNTAVWDSQMNDSAIPGLLKAAGITAMRYPGGSWADAYNWETQTVTGSSPASDTSFSQFMQTAQAASAAPIITVNYGSGSPSLAAAWVQDANVTNHYGIAYWEVGNEVYGNGFYGSSQDWEEDNHASKSPDTYAENFLQYQSAMLAVDPSIKVCATLDLLEGASGPVGPGDTMDWNHTVLSIIGSHLQCVIVHDYPYVSSTSAMLNQPEQVPGLMSDIRSEMNEYAGPAAASAQILTTETDSNGWGLDTQPGALYTADTMMSMLENGSVNVDYWDEHNGGSSATSVDGVPDYNDEGMLSNGTSNEPAVNTPFAPYYAIMLLSKLASPGDELVGSSSGNSLIKVHAVRAANGDLDVLVENEDPGNSYSVGLNYSGFTPSGSPTVYTLGNGAQSVSTGSQSSTSSVTVAPYSLTVLQIPGNSGSGAVSPSPGPSGAASGAGRIVSADAAGTCVDDSGDSAADGTHVQMWDCNGSAAQDWTLAADGTVQLNGKCLDINGAGVANGTLVQLWDCNGGANQQWSKGSAGTLVNPASGKCLDDPAYDTADGTQLQLYTCNCGSNQMWTLP